jgi:RNA polymerase sigma factor (TIGR02999 family)
MAAVPRTEVTRILVGLSQEAPDPKVSPEQLLPPVYDALRELARSRLRRERAGHTLQATDLVHEAYGRLADQSRVNWRGRTHFFAVAAQAMRRVLVDHARQRGRQKRGGGAQRVTLGGVKAPPGSELDLEELISLDRALKKLAALDERDARVVELRYFGGLTTREIADFLGVSERTVRGDWAFARAWLKKELSREEAR